MRVIEAIPEVMVAYDRMRTRGDVDLYDSVAAVEEIRRESGRDINVFEYQAMVIRFMTRQSDYVRLLKSAHVRVIAMK